MLTLWQISVFISLRALSENTQPQVCKQQNLKGKQINHKGFLSFFLSSQVSKGYFMNKVNLYFVFVDQSLHLIVEKNILISRIQLQLTFNILKVFLTLVSNNCTVIIVQFFELDKLFSLASIFKNVVMGVLKTTQHVRIPKVPENSTCLGNIMSTYKTNSCNRISKGHKSLAYH